MFGHREARLGQIEHLPLLSPPDHRRRQPGEAMATRFRLVPLDDVGLGDRLQRASGMSRLPAARLARLAARAAGDPRRLPQAIARRRLATVRTVFVQLTPKLRHLLPQRRVFRPQNLNLALQRRNQIPNSGRIIIHTLTHISPSPVPKNRTPSRLFTNTVAIPTYPSLGVTDTVGYARMGLNYSHSIIISHHNALISKRKFPWLIANSRKVIRQKFSLLILKGIFAISEFARFRPLTASIGRFFEIPSENGVIGLAEKTPSGSAATTWT